jgi:hypothetical protein
MKYNVMEISPLTQSVRSVEMTGRGILKAAYLGFVVVSTFCGTPHLELWINCHVGAECD